VHGAIFSAEQRRPPIEAVHINRGARRYSVIGLYQPGVIVTYEAGFWWFSARSVRSDDVVHRYEGATQSEGHQKPPAGLTGLPAGLRRSVATMNHIAASAPPRQRASLSILIGHDHPRLVLGVVRATRRFSSGRRRVAGPASDDDSGAEDATIEMRG
jgi:hypothetical protein